MKAFQVLCIGILLVSIVVPLYSETNKNKVQDATEEVNEMDYQPSQFIQNTNNEYDEDKTTQVVLGHFAGVVANFFNIAQDPNNAQVVAPSIVNMIGGMVNIVMEALKSGKLAFESSQEEIMEYVETLDDSFKLKLVKLIVAKKSLL